MNISLSRKVALVTGASRGLGRAIALALGQAGAHVAVTDILVEDEGIDPERLKALGEVAERFAGSQEVFTKTTAAEIEQMGPRSLALQMDVTKPDQIDDVVSQVEKSLGSVDILVNNAGLMGNFGFLDKQDGSRWETDLSVNLGGAFHCTKAVWPKMKEKRWGRVINISSIAARLGALAQPGYGASKAGLIGLTRTLALEGAGHGITVNALLPGFMETEVVRMVKGKGWRYDFTLNGQRLTAAWFKTKKEAAAAEAKRKEEMENPEVMFPVENTTPTPTDMAFLELVNRRLDYVKAFNSEGHYRVYVSLAKKWAKRWGKLTCSQVNKETIVKYVLERSKVSAYTANREIRCLRATFNWGISEGLLRENPSSTIKFLPVDRKLKYIPSLEDINRVIAVADPDTQDYLWTIRDTLGRVSEINRLAWDDVNFEGGYLILYTRKKKGGHLTPRKVPMTERLQKILERRYRTCDKSKPWVFWHSYTSSKTGMKVDGPYKDRKKFMRSLCKKAGVRYFRFHPIRHSGATTMDQNGIPIGSIQSILGHEHRSTTEIYLHSTGNQEREAMTAFEKASEKSHTDSHTDGKGVTGLTL